MQETQYEDRKEVRVGPLDELLKTTKTDLEKLLVKSVTITTLSPYITDDELARMIRAKLP